MPGEKNHSKIEHTQNNRHKICSNKIKLKEPIVQNFYFFYAKDVVIYSKNLNLSGLN